MLTSFLLSLLPALVSSVPLDTPALSSIPTNQIVHEKRALSGLEDRSRVDSNAILPVRIGLVQRNLESGYDHLMSVSDPNSAEYGKHWTHDQIEEEFAPSEDSVDAVRSWLAEHGIESAQQPGNKGWLAFDASLHLIEKVLDTQFYEYKTKEGDAMTIGCDQYSLPDHIAPHVDYVTPGVKASPRMTKRTVKRSLIGDNQLLRALNLAPEEPSAPIDQTLTLNNALANCGHRITPPCLRKMYGLPEPPSGKGLVDEGQLGVFEYGNDAYAQQDLDSYFCNFAPYVPNGTFPQLVSINNGTAPANLSLAGSEADIDFQIAYAVVGASNITLYETLSPENATYASGNFIEPFIDAIDGSFCTTKDRDNGFQCGTAPTTSVISYSYESSEMFMQTAKFQRRACNEFMKQGLKGVTMVFSTGDYGVASNPLLGGEDLCGNNGCQPQSLHSSVYDAFNGTIFSPGFPSNCPYVLSVGATQLNDGQSAGDAESAMNLPGLGVSSCDMHVTFSSSGGFSNYFSRPSYQDAAVGSYFSAHSPSYKSYESNNLDVANNKTTIGKNGGIYNRAGRGIPDVSANGAKYFTFNMGKRGMQAGTSLSTPLWAALISLINQQRKDAGKGPVGFVNPVLYKHPEVFHDVVNGTNPGCGTDGFAAVEGWDPITGLGTPNYPALLSLFMGMP